MPEFSTFFPSLSQIDDEQEEEEKTPNSTSTSTSTSRVPPATPMAAMEEEALRELDPDDHASRIAVLMVPFPAHSHLNQLLQFACLVASHGLTVHFAASAVHNRQARTRATAMLSDQIERIHFHDMDLPTFVSPPPDPNSPTMFPAQLLPSWYAALSLRRPFAAYLQDMSRRHRRVVVVHDPSMAAVVQDVVLVHNAESYVFNCLSAFFRVPFSLARLGKPIPEDYPKLPSFEGCLTQEVMEFVAIHHQFSGNRNGDIYNTCRHDCLEWLDKQEANSVIYVSFGTTTSLSNEQIKELALGLEQSEVKFLWVLRDADKADIFDGHERVALLPEGFQERTRDVGFVYRSWAPQQEILRHGSTGGFMSHCGWNSCMESITAGVPVAAWPMHSDQPINATFVTEVLKMGLIVRDWSQRTEIVKAGGVESAVRRLMAAEEGNELRKKAGELAATVRQATQAGGASQLEMASFIAHITR